MAKRMKMQALYERLSHDDEVQGESNSITNQKRLLEEYAEDHGFRNYRHFTDDGISGTRFDRPGFTQMMKEVDVGNVDVVVVKDMSRLGRDYLKVGQIMEMLRQKGVRLIAVNDNVDSVNGDDDFTPFRNIMNEWYARDTSKKIKSVFRAKGKAGKHVASSPPYGYLKDPNDATHWIIDEEAAEVVRRIYRMTLDGKGPYQITTILEAERVEIPAYHEQKLGVGNYQGRQLDHPYHWTSSTVVSILTRQEYLGHTVNFKTQKNFKDSHSRYVEDDRWLIFEDTQEAIIDQYTYDMVQRIRSRVKRWPNGWGDAHPLAGLVFCADCGGPLYTHRINNDKLEYKFYCGNYPQKKCASGHRIDADTLLQIVGETLKAIRRTIRLDRDAFVKAIEADIDSQQTDDIKKVQRKKLSEFQQRQRDVEKLLGRTYEDKVLGNLSEKQYAVLSQQYEEEMSILDTEIENLQKEIDTYQNGAANARKFMDLIDKYENFDHMNMMMCHEFLDKIIVHEREWKGSPQSPQQVDIYFNFIGCYLPPDEPIDPEVAAAQEEERRKLEERRAKLHANYLHRREDGSYQAWEKRYNARRQELREQKRAALPPSNGIPAGEYKKQRTDAEKAEDESMKGVQSA